MASLSYIAHVVKHLGFLDSRISSKRNEQMQAHFKLFCLGFEWFYVLISVALSQYWFFLIPLEKVDIGLRFTSYNCECTEKT